MARVKFCGNCNPDVHPRKVKEALAEEWVQEDKEILVDGCSRACLSKKALQGGKKDGVTVMTAKEIARRHR
jgi:hypothetical protein